MKRIECLALFFLLLLSTGLTAQEDAITEYFDQYVDDENFTSIYISGRMFQMVSNLPENEEFNADIKSILSDLDGLRILSTEANGKKYFQEAIKLLPIKSYAPLMKVRDESEEVQFLIQERDGLIRELLLLVGSEDEFVLLSFTGKIDLEKISRLSGAINIGGLEHLDKIGSSKENR